MTRVDAVVIGAGLSGLASAYRLHRAGKRVLVLEGGDAVGGVIQSQREDGYLLETGPNTFTSTGEALMDLCGELDLAPVSTAPSAKKRYLYSQGRLNPVPENPLALLTTPLLSTGAKLRMLKEPFIKPIGVGEATVAAFIRHRLGQAVLDQFVAPFLSGVYAGDPEELSIHAVFPTLARWERDYGSLIRGALQANKSKKPGKRPYALLGFSEGMAALPRALAGQLPTEAVRLNTVVSALEPDANGYRCHLDSGEIIEATSVVIATPADVTADLLAPVNAGSADILRQIPYAPIAVVHLGFRAGDIPHPLDGFGFLVPRTEQIPLLGSIWSSSLFPDRIPDDHVLLTCFLGGATAPEWSECTDEELIAQAVRDLSAVFQATRLAPGFATVFNWRRGIPQYTLGHRDRIARLQENISKHPGLALAGNYLAGVSLNDCVLSGNRAAEKILGPSQAPPDGDCPRPA